MANKITTQFARTRQMLFTKTGHSEETIDVQYHYEKERTFSSEERLVKIQKNSKKLIELYKELNKITTDIAQDACDLYDTQDPMWTPGSKLRDVASNNDKHLLDYTEQMNEPYTKPLTDYISQYKEARKRTEELTTRKVDMDRYKNEVGKLREKGAGSSSKAKLAPTEEKYRICKEGYDTLHVELLNDLPRLNDDKLVFINYLVASLIKNQSDLHKKISYEWSPLPSFTKHVDEYSGRDHQPVITSVERSAASINLRSDPVFKSNASIKMKPGAQDQQQVSTVDKDIHQSPNTSNLNLQKSTPNPYSGASAPPPSYGGGGGGSTATALYDFSGVDSSELSFRAGDIIIIHKSEGEWWEGELNGVFGFAPGSYLRMN
ncbi:hypothetical protein ACTA71_002374 [Dictyostelium dimigraforme]